MNDLDLRASVAALPHRFPAGFLWGTASSAYQVEGAVTQDGRGPSIWDTFTHIPGNVHRGDTGDISCDEYHHVDQNIELMARFGLNAYRFSVAWPRIQPDGKGRPNQRGLDYYRRLVDLLRKRRITPLVTLYHWDLPQGLEDEGGWVARDTSKRFAQYAAIMYEALGPSVPYWVTVNEPQYHAWAGYGGTNLAPGRSSVPDALAATHHLLLGHGLAVEAMRAAGHDESLVGIAHNLSPVRPHDDDPDDREAARRIDGVRNRLVLDPIFRAAYPQDIIGWFGPGLFSFVRDGDFEQIAQPIDFLGANYYNRMTVSARPRNGEGHDYPYVQASNRIPPGVRTTASGWPVEPDGLTELLRRLKEDYVRDRMPILVTENGCAADDYVDPEGEIKDDERITYLTEHISAIADAIDMGVDVRGYMIWSFLDNFEWAEGFSKRFGLVYVDYGTQRRIPKRSACWYRELIRGHQEHTAPRAAGRPAAAD